VRAGNYPLLIKVIEIPLTAGTAGGLTPGTALQIAERWMRIDPVSGSEAFRFNQQNSKVTHSFEFRQYTTGITAKMKMLYGARLFEIVAVMHDENRKRWTRLICNEYPEIPPSIGQVLGLTGLADLKAGLLSERPSTSDEGDIYAAIDVDTMYVWFDPTEP